MALRDVHAVEVVHCNVAPRNFLLNEQLDLHIADLAGCSVSRSPPLIAPGPRYQPPGWTWMRDAIQSDDVFALGSVLCFIATSSEPYPDLDEDQMQCLFEQTKFPDTEHLVFENTIPDCWNGRFATAQQVVDALNDLGWEVDIGLSFNCFESNN